MKTTTEKGTRKNALLKKFHTVCGMNGLTTEDKEAILNGNGVESSKDLSEAQLISIIAHLTEQTSGEGDKLRKRVMAAIGAWLKLTGRNESAEYIKAIACQAAKKTNFNKLTIGELKRIYSEFVHKAKTKETVANLKAKEIRYVAMMN